MKIRIMPCLYIFTESEVNPPKEGELDKYDAIGIGSGIYFGRHHLKIIEFASKLKDPNKKIKAITTTTPNPIAFPNGKSTISFSVILFLNFLC